MLYNKIEEAEEVLRGYRLKTPLIYAEALSERAGRAVWLKLESLQPTGSFKIRPALYGIASALEACREKGVLTSSSGNFAQAVAYAAKKLGVSAKIVMREDTAPIKLARTASWGAEIALCEASQAARFAMVSALQRVEQRHLLHPFDSLETIAADGTIGLEIAEDLGEAAMVLVPVSGGGLVSGIATALRHRFAGSQVYGVQSENNGSFLRALRAGKPVEVDAFSSCADALVATSTGEQAFSFARSFVAGGIEVSEEAIVAAVCWLAMEMPLVVEAGGAVGVAAILSGRIPSSSLPLVCVLSGANLERSKLAAWLGEKHREIDENRIV